MTVATYTMEEYAALMGVSLNGAYRAARRGDLPVQAIKTGGRWLVPRAPLDRLLGLTPETAAQLPSSPRGFTQ